MQSSARSIISAVGRGAELLTDVDYHLAETAAEKEEIYNLRYRAYLREGAVKESRGSPGHRPLRRAAERMDLRRLPSRPALQLGAYQRADLGMARIHLRRRVLRHFAAAARSRRGHDRPDALRRRSRPGQADSGTALSDDASGLYGMRAFQCRSRPCDRARRASGVLPPGVPARTDRRAPAGSRVSRNRSG